jgi:hypothetical protein
MKGSVKNTPIQQPINPTIDNYGNNYKSRRIRGCFDTIENYIL